MNQIKIGDKVVYFSAAAAKHVFEVTDCFAIRKGKPKLRLRREGKSSESVIFSSHVRLASEIEILRGEREEMPSTGLKFKYGLAVVLVDEKASNAILRVIKGYTPASLMPMYQLALNGAYIAVHPETALRAATKTELQNNHREKG